MKKISIGVCCYNEELNIEPMYQALTNQMRTMPNYEYEIIFEDNASTDGSEEILERIASQDEHVRVYIHSSNFGVEKSAYNCMKNACGDAFISIPCDFEEPPEMIPQFVQAWEMGHQVVLGQKNESEEGGLICICRSLYYSIIDFFSDKKQLRQVTGFGLYDRTVVDIILSVKQHDPFVYTRHQVVEYGFDVVLIPYKHGKRVHGVSSFSGASYLNMAINSLTNTTTKPIRMITLLGVFGVPITVLLALVFFVMGNTAAASFVAGLIMDFVQILCVGLIGEYIAAVHRKVTAQAPIVVRRVIDSSTDLKTDSNR